MFIDQKQARLAQKYKCGKVWTLQQTRTHQSDTTTIFGLRDLDITLKTLGLDIIHF